MLNTDAKMNPQFLQTWYDQASKLIHNLLLVLDHQIYQEGSRCLSIGIILDIPECLTHQPRAYNMTKDNLGDLQPSGKDGMWWRV